MTKKIKVLQVVACMTYGGTEAFIMNHYRKIDREKFEYDFWIFNADLCDHRDEIVELNHGENNIYAGFHPQITKVRSFVNELAQFIRERKYDAVHSHVNSSNAFVLLAARKAGVPIRVSHAHDSKPLGKKKPSYWIMNDVRKALLRRCATVFLACSEEAGNYVYGKKCYKKRGNLILNGIDIARYFSEADTAELKKRIGIPDNLYIIGNITRFEDKKNPLFLIKTFRKLLDLDSENYLILGGPDGGQLQEAVRLVEKLGLQEKVLFIGPVREVDIWIKMMDIYIFPSKYEGFAITLLENQACGIYSLVSDTVPRTADMGLGLIQFLDLDMGEEKWAQRILEYKRNGRKNVSKQDILRIAKEGGFDVSESVRRLESIYQGCPVF